MIKTELNGGGVGPGNNDNPTSTESTIDQMRKTIEAQNGLIQMLVSLLQQPSFNVAAAATSSEASRSSSPIHSHRNYKPFQSLTTTPFPNSSPSPTNEERYAAQPKSLYIYILQKNFKRNLKFIMLTNRR